jgi:outer membrane protein assembly factor BamB
MLPPSEYLGEWRSEGGNPEKSGSLNASLTFPLQQTWKAKVGRGIMGSPVPAGSLVIAATTDGRIRAYHIEDGKKLWGKKIKGGYFSTPVVSDRKLFITSEFPDGSLYCLEIQRGKTIWKKAIGPCRSTSTIDGGVIYTITNAGDALAHMTTNGDLLWKKPINSLHPQSPLVIDDLLFILSENDSLKILSTVDGSILERHHLPLSPHPGSAILPDCFLYGSRGGIGMFSTSPTTIEDNLSDAPETYRMAIAGDVILGVDGRRQAFAYDKLTGEVLWTDEVSGLLEARPTVAGDKVIITSLTGEIRVLDLRSGDVLWEENIEAPISSPPLVSGKRLLLTTEKGELIVYASETNNKTKEKNNSE